MNNLSNTSRLKRMGILDIIAAIFLVIMGAMLLNVDVNAKYGAGEVILQALKFLIGLVLGMPALVLIRCFEIDTHVASCNPSLEY